MSNLLAVLGCLVALVASGAIFALLTWMLRGREGFWPDVLGTFTRIFVSCALGAALVALAVTVWLSTAERHSVRLMGVGEGDAPTCTFVWPGGGAPSDQRAFCPGTRPMRGDEATAVRLPGTELVVLNEGPVDPFTSFLLWGVGLSGVAALIGGGLNARPDKRWRDAQERRMKKPWAAGGPSTHTGPGASMPTSSGSDDLH